MSCIVTERGPCVSEHYLTVFKRYRLPTRKCLVKTVTGVSERDMYKIRIKADKPETVFCDRVTGSLYSWQGRCLSSTRRRIVRWL